MKRCPLVSEQSGGIEHEILLDSQGQYNGCNGLWGDWNASYVVAKMFTDPPAEWVEARHDSRDPLAGSRRIATKHVF